MSATAILVTFALLAHAAPAEGAEGPEVVHRLGEASLARGAPADPAAAAALAVASARCRPTPGCQVDALPRPPVRSRRSLAKGIETLDALATEFPSYEHLDDVVYTVGRAQWILGERDAAAESFRRLVQSWPVSPRVPEAYAALGDYHADRGNLHAAIVAYATATRGSPSSPYAWYALAWCYMGVGERALAVEALTRAVGGTDVHEGGTDPHAAALVSAIREAARADLGRLGEAPAGP